MKKVGPESFLLGERGTPEERRASLNQIRTARSLDRALAHGDERLGKWKRERGGRAYCRELGGIAAFFEYVRLLGVNRVLDIGAGNLTGICELADSVFGNGLNFEATCLSYHMREHNAASRIRRRITSVEALRGIPDAWFGGVIALYSVAYATSQQQAARSIDRVLAPGGVFKGRFAREEDAETHGGMIPSSSRKLRLAFEDMGYDARSLYGGVMIAIKPGGPAIGGGSAQSLALLDEGSYVDQETCLEQSFQSGSNIMKDIRAHLHRP